MCQLTTNFTRLLLAAGMVAWSVPGRADVVRLRSGSELRGTLLDAGNDPAADSSPKLDHYRVQTLSGVIVEVRKQDVSFVVKRPRLNEIYEVRARNTPETAEAQWELAIWCKEQKLTAQSQDHAEKTVALNPLHEPAHRALGHVWKEDAWVDLDVYMTERGYVKHRGRWITQQEMDLLDKTAAELEREQEWFPKIRVWMGWISGNHVERARKGLQSFQDLNDPDAAPAILRLMSKHPSRDVRLVAVQTLSRMPGSKSAAALAQFVIADVDPMVSSMALEGIPLSLYSSVQAIFIQKLTSSDNFQVNRAASALAKVGDAQAVTPLINALITSHMYQVRVSGSAAPTYAFGTDGSFASPGTLPLGIEAGLRTGQFPDGVIVLNSPFAPQNMNSRIVTIKRDQQNPEVLAALQKITMQDFQYDERTWHLWWAAEQHQG